MTATSGLPDAVLVIAGPTASGKTDLAAAVARRFDAEVVSADSRQIYRHMDVGTAKPEPSLLSEIRHHMVDVAEPDEPFDTAAWCDGARDALIDIEARGRRAVVCGGTGLYIRSLLRGLFDGPRADPQLRSELERVERQQPGELVRRLVKVDPAAAARIHPNDKVRLVRALEVYELTGRTLTDWHSEHALAQRPFREITVAPDWARDTLYERIDRRSAAIVEAGLLEELAALRERGFAADLRAFDAIGYREAGLCLDGRLERPELIPSVARATRRYAKRQLVWLRGQGPCRMLPAGDVEGAFRAAEEVFAAS